MNSISDILISIGRAIRADSSILASCKSLFGKGMSVTVGGYAQNVVDESNAPFTLVMADNTECDVSTNEILSLSVKVVVGICPVKDVPSTDEVDAALESVDGHCADGETLAGDLSDLLEDDTDKAFVDAALEAIETANESLATAKTGVESAKSSSDYSTMLTNYAAAKTAAESVSAQLTSVVGHTYTEPSAAVTAKLAEVTACGTALAAAITAFGEAITAASAEFTAFEENPYITDVVAESSTTANGLTVYGAQRTLDDIRSKIVDAVYATDLGLVVESVKINCNSTSHYPLDWSEITFELTKPATLNL